MKYFVLDSATFEKAQNWNRKHSTAWVLLENYEFELQGFCLTKISINYFRLRIVIFFLPEAGILYDPYWDIILLNFTFINVEFGQIFHFFQWKLNSYENRIPNKNSLKERHFSIKLFLLNLTSFAEIFLLYSESL